jgi:hypothetical protein
MNSAKYRVIGVRANGQRELRAGDLGKETAEAVREAAMKSGLFVRVFVERQISGDRRPAG